MKSIKVAFVGAGYMAREHARAFSGLPGVELSGIFSRTKERAQAVAEEFGIEKVCDSIDQLFHSTGADLVVVTVREMSMNQVATACFAFPWTVLLEKPAGYNLADAESICRAASSATRPVYVALNRRAYSSTRQADAFVSDAEGLRLVVVQDQQDMDLARSLGEPEEVVRNYMFANSIHVIDYLRVFCRGDVTSINHAIPWNPEQPGFVVATVNFSSGDTGVYQGIWNGPGPWAVAVSTPAIRLEMRPLEALSIQHRGERKLLPVEIDSIDTDYKPGLRFQAREAVAAARGETTQLATLADATESMRLCARIFGL